MNKYFYCYSWNLKEKLIQLNIPMIMYSTNPKTNKMFWVFENSDQITRILEAWRLNKTE